MIGFWHIVRTTEGELAVYKDGKRKTLDYYFKKLTPKQNKIFDELIEEYLKQL